MTDVVIASDQVSVGALFACVPGSRADGHDYAGEAVEKGAVALLCERPLDVPVPQVVVPSVRRCPGAVSGGVLGLPGSSDEGSGRDGDEREDDHLRPPGQHLRGQRVAGRA